MKEMWESRYSAEDYAYGIEPNTFFKETLEKYKLEGTILLPAEGEGRNAVFAAKKGLNVLAFDISEEGKKKALKLAAKQNVTINYKVGDFFNLDIVNHKYESVALIFAHFPVSILSKYHKKIGDLIKPNGLVILEGFSKNHLKLSEKNPSLGGPKNIEVLFSKESIQNDFPDFEILLLEESNVNLSEGKFHNGESSVIRFIGRKKEK
ncbi:Methyltransferase domain-containing protein [Polaribacter sp. KT25b]|uniref:class I SAM-dependent methyltransferase n=1 Tax=Polaribacter sp. KT25b TaxID=1855336 RepID=UPI0008792E9C|nr:class I SAM-dependent methyltransferase [Polaribacter sp. KT25b]SDR75860.1 Methyltransferase domain-containing protein [Polaribacter sp. KT25b]